MVAEVISELKSISRLNSIRETGPCISQFVIICIEIYQMDYVTITRY